MTKICILLICICSLILDIESDTFECNTANSCTDSNYHCAEGEDCTIICSSTNACGSSIFQCPTTHQCNIECNADGSACEKTHFLTYDSTLTTNGQNNQFMAGQLICGKDSECTLKCGVENNSYGNTGMCKQSIIDASEASTLNIMALGQETLRYAHIYCPENGNCNIDLIGTNTGSYKISNAAIFINDPDNVNLVINCEDNNVDTCYGDTQNAPILFCYNKTYSCTYRTDNGHDWFCNENSPCGRQYSTSSTNVPNNNDDSKSYGWVIGFVIIFIILCCVIVGVFLYRWHQKRGGKYEGLLEDQNYS
eukprot:44668_1